MSDILYITVPCFNEEEVLPETAKRLQSKLENLIDSGIVNKKSKILFIDDGSTDKTFRIISELCKNSHYFAAIKLSRNVGHQNALLSGLMYSISKTDVTISIDADLQDDIDAIDEMLKKYYEGCDIVYGVRSDRKTDTFLKRFTAETFYRMINFLGAKTVFNHADYRLMSRRAIAELKNFGEVNMYLRGIIPMIGFKSDIVYYSRNKRFAGKSKYPFRKMLSLALDGITSLSSKPIRYISLIGFLIFIVSIIMILNFIIDHFTGDTVSGWASVICSVWAIGGLIMLSLGIIGEYIGKIYLETKQRPKFIIDTVIDSNEQSF